MSHFARRLSPSRSRLAAFGVVMTSLALSSVAAAQQPPQNGAANCPPGSWFCESSPSTPATAPAAGSGSGQLQPLPPADAKPAAAAPATAPAAAAAAPAAKGAQAGQSPPVVIYQPGPPVVVVQGKADKPAAYPYTPRDGQMKPRREWGLNLHLQGAMLGRGRYDDAGMGGVGLGVRFRPHPVVAIEPTIDFYGGRDYNGYRRGETAFTLNTLIFATPRAKVVQLYFPIGFGWSGARVEDDRNVRLETATMSSYQREQTYSYFGMQAGIGLEFRLARHFALNTDIRGFIRGRTDDDAKRNPEFVDGTRSTNTSGGGLMSLGMTFYF